MKNILITGAAGFIGMHTCIKFIEEGYNVFGLDNINDYYDVSLKKDRLNEIKKISSKNVGGWEFIKADITSDKTWKELKKYKIDKIIHLAAQAGVRYSIENPMAYLKSNIIGFQNILDFCYESKINDLIYASSSSVYGKDSKQPFYESYSCNNPESYYAVTKKTNELMANAYFKTKRISSVGLRFFTVYGPWGRPDMAPMLFANAAIKKNNINVFNYGNQSRDFTYIDDIIEGIFLVSVKTWHSKKPILEIFNIGNGSPVKLMDFINLLEDCLELKIKKSLVSAQLGDVETTFASVDKLERFIKYKPSTSLNKGIRKFINWYMQYYNL